MSTDAGGTQTSATNASTDTFLTALWLNGAVFAAEIIAFTLLLHKFRAIYEPRTYIPIESKRSEPLPRQMFKWPLAVFKADYRNVKAQNGMDAYFFVRYLRMMIKIFLPIWIVSWAVLLPVTSIKTGTGKKGLDMFTFGNVPPSQPARYAAHISLVWFFTIYIFYVIKAEMRHFVTTRQRHLVDPAHSGSAQANTVLITGVPPKFLSEKALFQLYSYLPGGVRKVWLNRNLKELPDIYERRLAACNKLESAETALIATAVKLRSKNATSEKTDSKDALSPIDPEDSRAHDLSLAAKLVPRDERPTHRLPLGFMPFALPLIGKKVDSINWARDEITRTTEALERGRVVLRKEVDASLARQRKGGKGSKAASQGVGGIVGGVVDVVGTVQGKVTEKVAHRRTLRKKGPRSSGEASDSEKGSSPQQSPRQAFQQPPQSATTHNTDTTHNTGSENNDENDEGAQEALRSANDTYPPLNSAFILFNSQIAAHMAAQILTHNEPYRMATKYTEVAPADVIWGNLGLNPYETQVRKAISYGITAGLIILWVFPVTFVGAISNVSSLCVQYHWLAWICKLPPTILGIIQGILPPVALAILMMLLPIILRLLARIEGIPRRTGLELSLMTRYFIFQVIHGFLVVTLSSGLIAALPGLINNPGSIPTLLASNLPKASNFFLTYAILQGLTGTAAGFLQIVPLILYYVKLFILGSTPRSVYNIKYTMRDVAWGTLFPAITLLTVIALAYSIISPIINGLACASFFLFYQLWKYLFLYQLEQPAAGDTGGLFFPKAMQHIFVGLYVQQICLAALFFLARDQNKKPSAIPEGALMIVLLVVTVFYNLIIVNSYGPLLHSLPLTLADKSHGRPRLAGEQEHLIKEGDKDHDEFTSENDKREYNRMGRESVEEGYDTKPLPSSPAQGAPPSSKSSKSPFKLLKRRGGNNTDDDDVVVTISDDPDAPPPPAPGVPLGADGKQRIKEDMKPEAVGQEGKHNEDPTDFYHPAGVEGQRIIWIPRDPFGFGDGEVKDNAQHAIVASVENAVMNEKGKVDIEGDPPGMNRE
ncbi:DUF221-domain-containing protein [Rickenella mellea]|uniref:DUF221-domain-containing protein n=1 Tax=Rickenella mellea TaxID=50990 RepID=A0A4Y7Q7I1_9AGAM|nr:DUF221-domain-containing protein [Rickenella mellea]